MLQLETQWKYSKGKKEDNNILLKSFTLSLTTVSSTVAKLSSGG